MAKAAEIIPMPGYGLIAKTINNVQGSFQLCRYTGEGLMTIMFEGGIVDIKIPPEMAQLILIQTVPEALPA